MVPSEDRFAGGVATRSLPRSTTALAGYVVAVGAVAASLLFRYLLRDSFGLKVPYLQFYPAIILAAWYGGLGPAVLATAISAVATMYFLLPPDGFAVAEFSDQLSLAVFAGTGFVIGWLNHRLHLAEDAQRKVAAIATARAERLALAIRRMPWWCQPKRAARSLVPDAATRSGSARSGRTRVALRPAPAATPGGSPSGEV